jgi:uncharacterized protein YndB with AHSA1/START domain
VSRDIVLAIEIESEPKGVFDTVASRSGLAAFWTPDVAGDGTEGGELSLGFASAPTRLALRVTRSHAPDSIGWRCATDWPFWDGTTVSWTFEPSEHGTQVLFRHLGYADEMPDVAFGSIALTWGTVVSRLKQVIESGGAADPVLA